MTDRTILVCGATGRQGGAVARQLLAEGWRVRALTRRPNSDAAVTLRCAGAEIVAGDLADAASLRAAVIGASGVFGVTDFWEHGRAAETRQGKALVDAAIGARVNHFIFSSVGGTDRTEGLGIDHFDSKREIEDHLRASGLPYTIFRPVTLFENFVSPRYRRAIHGRGVFDFAIDPDRPFQMVAIRDIAVFVAKAFADRKAFQGRSVELASDRFTMRELSEALGRAVGHPVRYRYLPVWVQHVVGAYVGITRTSGKYKVGRSLIRQFRWNNDSATGGWNADLDALRAVHPGLLSLDAWVRTVAWDSQLREA